MSRILLPILLLFSIFASGQKGVQPATGFQDIPPLSDVIISQSSNSVAWDESEPLVNGFARVLRGNKFSYVNEAGILIRNVDLDGGRNFVNHLAAAKKGSKWGFINESGIAVIPFEYDIVFDFKENITVVCAGNKWALLDLQGIVVKSLDITGFYGFNNGIARIIKDGKNGLMNTNGEIVGGNENAYPEMSRLYPLLTNAAGACPPNIDFENGTFLNWKCFTGRVDSVGNTNLITVIPSASIPDRHTIINRSLPSGVDPFGLFPTNPPDGSNFAVKLGNTRIGAESERIQYTIRIPANDSNFSIKYNYAVVFEDPGHTAWTQPRFTAKLFDSAANTYINCASFEYIATSSLPGFGVSPVDTTVIFKPWSSAYISLRNYAGKTLYLEFTTADCVRRGHWGYAYVDVESNCANAIEMHYDCSFPNIATLAAPPGFQTYNWWNQDFTALLGSGQQIILNPGPPVNSIVHLEMIPFNDFGCRDTMPVRITGNFPPHFDVSQTIANCAPHRFTFYNRNLPSASVTWDFGDGTTGTGDTVSHLYTLPGTYIVTMNVTLPGGCTATTTETIWILHPSGSLNYTGGNFCGDKNVQFNASGTNISNITWDFGDGFILNSAQTSITHTYSLPGLYIPYLIILSEDGCEVNIPGPDTIRIEKLEAGFSHVQQSNCNSSTVRFIDTSISFFGALSYNWNFGDGTTGSGDTITHVYASSGTYIVQLIVIGITGCKDTINKTILVAINSIPMAAITGPVIECSLVPVTFSSVIQSADPLNSYAWISSDGSQGSGNSFTVNYLNPGNYNIQLITGTVNGCFDTAMHQVLIRPVPDVLQPADQEVCNGAVTTAVIYTGSPGAVYSWSNNTPSIGLALGGSGDIPSFTAINNTGAPVTAAITVIPTNGICPGMARSFTITVQPAPTVPQPANQAVCNNNLTTAIILTSFTNAVSPVTYSWSNNLPSIGLASSGTGNIPAFTAVNNSTVPVTATITITPAINGCAGIPVAFTIIINPTPALNPPVNHSFCNGDISSVINFTGNIPGTAFNWINDQPSIGISVNGYDSIGSFTAINTTNGQVISTISVQPVFNSCPGTPESFTIIVHPTPIVNQPANQSLCNGDSTNAILFSSLTGGTVYTWSNDLPSIGLPANGTGNIPSFNPSNISSVAVNANFTVTPTANGCPGTAKVFTITIMPRPTLIQPLNLFLCNGETTPTMDFTSSISGVTYTWANSMPSIGLPASGTGIIPSFNASNNTNVALLAAVTVTASTNSCASISKTFYISVDPTPGVAPIQNLIVCNGAVINPIQFTGTVIGTSFNWINNLSSIGLAANGTGNIPSFIAVNNTNYPITSIISVTGTANSCGSALKVFTITVNPSPDVDVPGDIEVCNGTATAGIPITGQVSGTSFNWTNNNPLIGLAANGSGDIPAFTAINNTGSTIIATIAVTGTGNSCGSRSRTFTISIHPTPSLAVSNNINVCLGNSVQLSATGASQYSWSPATGLSCVDCPSPLVIPTDPIRYVVSGVSNFGCMGFDSVFLSVKKPFEMVVPPNDTLCLGESTMLNALHANSYLWYPAAGLNRTDIAAPRATPFATTRYRVVGYDAYNCFTDTGYVTVTIGPKPVVNLGPDINATTGSAVTLHAAVENGPIVSWLWSPAAGLNCSDCAEPTTTIMNGGTYSVRVENSYGCFATDIITVNGFCARAQVFIPNAFTPDGDGLNDVLMVRGSGIQVKSFRIFNRWGELVFEKINFGANDVKFGWDGKVRGVPARPEVFVYTAEVICDNNVVYTLKGNTTVLK